MPIIGVLAAGGLAPLAPTIGTATAGDASATVTFTAPSWVGKGSGTVTYTATSSPDGLTGTTTSGTSITVSGLTNGTAYTFTVKATTSYGVTGASSAASNSVTPALADTGSMFPMRSYVVPSGSSVSYIEWTSIPTTYTHLQVRGIVLGSSATATGGLFCQFNGDTNANYTTHLLGGNGSVASAYSATGRTAVDMYGYYDNIISTGSFPIAFVMDILDYKSTNKTKTIRINSGMNKNGSNYGEIFLKSSAWLATPQAINSIKIYINGQNLAANTSIALYGVNA